MEFWFGFIVGCGATVLVVAAMYLTVGKWSE